MTNPAVRAARAMMEIIGFTLGAVGRRLPSPIQRFRTPCTSPDPSAAEILESPPARAEPMGWAEKSARKGGQTVKAGRGTEFYREIGRKGGEARAEDREGMREAGRKGAEARWGKP